MDENSLQSRVAKIRHREGLARVLALEDLLQPTADQFETVDEHWIHGSDEGLSYCFDCAKAEVEKLLKDEPEGDYFVDGGWGSEGDSQAFCETCGHALNNPFTTYACEQELNHFAANEFDPESPDDCYAFCRIVGAEGCESSELIGRIISLADKILEKLERNESKHVQGSDLRTARAAV